MHDSDVSFGQACRVFWAFSWRFFIIAAILGGIGYAGIRMTMLSGPPVPANATAAAVTAPASIFKGPVVPTVALILLFVSGAFAMKLILGMEFGDFQLAVKSERRDDRPSQAERMLHSNPLSRNPQTASLKGGNKNIIYRN